jgi:outer membrane protein OmpA-like peptidoglycan-associated protein/tetratricopeptide (TPR) repeat protein
MNKTGILLIALFMHLQGFGQEIVTDSTVTAKSQSSILHKMKLDRANSLYNKLAYFQAAGLYEELVASNYMLKEVYPKLGDCYYNLSNTEKAEICYGEAVKLDEGIEPEYYLKYAQTLRSNGKYAESETWLNRYKDFFFTDTRIIAYEENKEAIQKLINQKTAYIVRERTDLNSEFSDFGAVPWNNKIVFTSGRTDNMYVKSSYAWNNKPFLDLYVYDTSRIAEERISILNKKINTQFHEGPVCFADDNNTLYFTRNNYYHGIRKNSEKGTNHLILFKTTLHNGNWGNIAELPFNNREYSVGHPCVSPDGKRLYFASDMFGTYGKSDIFYVDILENNQYGTPVNLGQVMNTEGNEMFPFIDETGIYFSSDGQPGLGGLDIFYCKQMSNGELAKPVNLGKPINSDKDDFCFILKPDKRSGFLASNRPEGKGDDDIYEFSISKLTLKGIVRDSSHQNTPVEKAQVTLSLASGETIDKFETSSDGSFAFPITFDNNYIVSASKAGYSERKKTVSTIGISSSEISQNIDIPELQPVIITGIIVDKKTSTPLSDVEITIIDTLKQTLILDTKTASDGLFRKELKDVGMKSHLAFRIMLRKAGYLAKTIVFDHYISSYEINMNQFLDVALDKIAVGVDIGKLLNISPIYFDLGKWDIRPDAAGELDKIVQAMKDNPTVVIELGSHTDSRGTEKANLDLSDKRAKASAEYIISQGIDSNRIYGKGYGESRLINKCKDGVKCTEELHSQNRRTEFKVVKM